MTSVYSVQKNINQEGRKSDSEVGKELSSTARSFSRENAARPSGTEGKGKQLIYKRWRHRWKTLGRAFQSHRREP